MCNRGSTAGEKAGLERGGNRPAVGGMAKGKVHSHLITCRLPRQAGLSHTHTSDSHMMETWAWCAYGTQRKPL